MRQLTAKQKKVLKQAMVDYNDLNMWASEDLPGSVWDKLVEINDTEILQQEVDRFMSDYRWGEHHKEQDRINGMGEL